MISEKPKFVVGDIVIVYIRQTKTDDSYAPVVKTKTITSIGLTGSVWAYNYDTPESFQSSEVEYVLRKGKWKL